MADTAATVGNSQGEAEDPKAVGNSKPEDKDLNSIPKFDPESWILAASGVGSSQSSAESIGKGLLKIAEGLAIIAGSLINGSQTTAAQIPASQTHVEPAVPTPQNAKPKPAPRKRRTKEEIEAEKLRIQAEKAARFAVVEAIKAKKAAEATQVENGDEKLAEAVVEKSDNAEKVVEEVIKELVVEAKEEAEEEVAEGDKEEEVTEKKTKKGKSKDKDKSKKRKDDEAVAENVTEPEKPLPVEPKGSAEKPKAKRAKKAKLKEASS